MHLFGQLFVTTDGDACVEGREKEGEEGKKEGKQGRKQGERGRDPGGISAMNLIQVCRWASSYPPYKCILEYGKVYL